MGDMPFNRGKPSPYFWSHRTGSYSFSTGTYSAGDHRLHKFARKDCAIRTANKLIQKGERIDIWSPNGMVVVTIMKV
jgi:hypothetical protein